MQPNLQPASDPVAEAIARRGMGQGTPSMEAPAMAPSTPVAPSPSMGAPMGAPSAPSAPSGKQEFQPKDGHEFLLATLAESLKNEYKLKGEQLKYGTPAL